MPSFHSLHAYCVPGAVSHRQMCTHMPLASCVTLGLLQPLNLNCPSANGTDSRT